MNFSGNFESTFLTSLLQLLCDDRKNGVLTVFCGDGKRKSKVYFKDGTIVYALTNEKHMRIGQMLKEDGLISEEQLVQCLQIAREKKVSIGKILIEKGHISASALAQYNSKHVENILYNILLWENGKFEYKDCVLNLSGLVVAELNSMRLIMEATRRIDEMSIFTKFISDKDQEYRVTSKAKGDHGIKLNSNEWNFLSLVDEKKSVRRIIDESSYDTFTVYKMLYSLLSYGLIEKRPIVDFGSNFSGRDCFSILSVYKDIFQVIHKTIIKELGQQAGIIFEESKSLLSEEAEKMLKNYFFYLTEEENTQTVRAELDEYKNLDEGCAILITSLNQYNHIILNKVATILGDGPTNNLIGEIEQILDYVNKYQLEPEIKIRIINEIKNSLVYIRERTGSR